MTELRKSVIDTIHQEVSSTYFGRDNYKVEFPGGSSVLVKITFIAQPKYQFTISDTYSGISTLEEPGAVKNSEEYSDLNMEKAIRRIDGWARRVRQELSSAGITEEKPDDFFIQIDEFVDSLKSPNEKFSTNEIDTLKAKLDTLEANFKELQEKSVITENELKTLKSQINSAEKDLIIYTKDIWYKTSMRKVVGTTKSILTSKEGKEVALGIVKKLIGLE